MDLFEQILLYAAVAGVLGYLLVGVLCAVLLLIDGWPWFTPDPYKKDGDNK